MIHFSTRRDKLVEQAIEYIETKLKEEKYFSLRGGDEIYEDLDNNGEMQNCLLEFAENVDGEYIVSHRGTLNECLDSIALDELSTDTLVAIADRIHTDNVRLKYDKN